jgi:DNA-directed RNA polymerase subunit F
MPELEAALSADELRREPENYHRHLAAEVVALLPESKADARLVLRLASAMLEMNDPGPEAEAALKAT